MTETRTTKKTGGANVGEIRPRGAGFTPLYAWVMARGDLTPLEKMIVCEVLRWKDAGCWESNATIAKKVGANKRSVKRAIKKLSVLEGKVYFDKGRKTRGKGWLIRCPESNRRRIIYVEPVRLSLGPLFGVVVPDPQVVVPDPQRWWSQTPQVYINRIIKSIFKGSASKLSKRWSKHKEKREFEQKKKEQIRSLFDG